MGAVINIIRPDILEVTGCLQMCAGQDSGCETAVHSIRNFFNSDDTECLLSFLLMPVLHLIA